MLFLRNKKTGGSPVPVSLHLIIYMQVRVQSDLAQKHFIYFHIIDPVFKYILWLWPFWICNRYKKKYLSVKTIQWRFQQGVISNGSVVHKIKIWFFFQIVSPRVIPLWSSFERSCMFQFIVTHSVFDSCLALGENKYGLVILSDHFHY